MLSSQRLDQLRFEEPDRFSSVLEGNLGRNLQYYDFISQEGESSEELHEQLLICHIPQFLRWTVDSNGTFLDYSDIGFGVNAATIMAIDHFNSGNGVIVKDIEDIHTKCKIRFTTEVFDTQASAITAVKGLTDMMILRDNSSTKPQPCAVLGTLYSSVAKKFATLTGVYDLLQVAPGASSDALDNKSSYPLFSRTHTSDGGAAKLLPSFLKHDMNVKNFAVVYLRDDDYGDSYWSVINGYAAMNGMNVLPVPLRFYPRPTKEELMEQLKPLLDSKLNYIIGVFFSDNYALIMETAYEMGLAGDGRMWLFCGALAEYLYEFDAHFETGSNLAKATYGNAVITDGGGAPGRTEYEQFVTEWKKLGMDSDKLAYINSKIPLAPDLGNFSKSVDWFENHAPNHVAVYAYEAIIGMGLSACEAQAQASNQNREIFTGKEHHTAFTNINFLSASGEVKIGPDNYSRNDVSTYYVVSNILEKSSTETSTILKGKDFAFYDALQGEWKRYPVDDSSSTTMDFIFPNGSTEQPSDIGSVEEDMNLISTGVRSFCLVLSSSIIGGSIMFIVYTVANRKKRFVKMSQPPFLIMICLGTFLIGTSIISLSMDEGVTRSIASLNTSCSSFPFLFCFGFVITFSALYSKLWRLNKIVHASASFQKVTVTTFDVIIPFVILSTLNVIILIIQRTLSPITWKRSTIEQNIYNQILQSEGFCNGDGAIFYTIALLIVNGIALILACIEGYRGRNVQTDLNESKNIGFAMVFIFQSFFFGVPLLFLTKHNKSALLFVATSICFVICIATLSYVFVPMILKQRQRDIESRSHGRNRSNLRSNNALVMSSVSNLKQRKASTSKVSGMGDRFAELRAAKKNMIGNDKSAINEKGIESDDLEKQ